MVTKVPPETICKYNTKNNKNIAKNTKNNHEINANDDEDNEILSKEEMRKREMLRRIRSMLLPQPSHPDWPVGADLILVPDNNYFEIYSFGKAAPGFESLVRPMTRTTDNSVVEMTRTTDNSVVDMILSCESEEIVSVVKKDNSMEQREISSNNGTGSRTVSGSGSRPGTGTGTRGRSGTRAGAGAGRSRVTDSVDSNDLESVVETEKEIEMDQSVSTPVHTPGHTSKDTHTNKTHRNSITPTTTATSRPVSGLPGWLELMPLPLAHFLVQRCSA